MNPFVYFTTHAWSKSRVLFIYHKATDTHTGDQAVWCQDVECYQADRCQLPHAHYAPQCYLSLRQTPANAAKRASLHGNKCSTDFLRCHDIVPTARNRNTNTNILHLNMRISLCEVLPKIKVPNYLEFKWRVCIVFHNFNLKVNPACIPSSSLSKNPFQWNQTSDQTKANRNVWMSKQEIATTTKNMILQWRRLRMENLMENCHNFSLFFSFNWLCRLIAKLQLLTNRHHQVT